MRRPALTNSWSGWWQRYLVVVSREMPSGLPLTERARRIIHASAGARDVLERTDRLLSEVRLVLRSAKNGGIMLDVDGAALSLIKEEDA